MDLANLFLADLGPELRLTPGTLREACFALRRNRADWLLGRRTRPLADMIAHTAAQWLEPGNGFRALALRDGPAATGFGAATLGRGLDAFFRALTAENIEALVVQDLGDMRRLDEFVAGAAEMRTGRMSFAHGPELLAHVTAGNLPCPALFSMVLGVLARSAQVVKCPAGASLLPRLFAHSLAATESKLAACIEIVEWTHDAPGAAALEDALFAESEVVTATGGDAMVADLRHRMPPTARLVAHGHRLSFGFVAREALSHYSLGRLVRAAAEDVTAWNQLGCLSPHVFYVEGDHGADAENFASALAAELARREAADPRGELPPGEAAAIASRRSAYALRAAAAAAVTERNLSASAFFESAAALRLWCSEGSTAWTVVFDGDPRFKASCLNRFVYVKPVRGLDEVLRFAEPVRHQVSTVAVAAPDERLSDIARRLARWGASRICPVGRMQDPPPAWRHDGRPALGDLVAWTDLET
jgi:hypothetical protein